MKETKLTTPRLRALEVALAAIEDTIPNWEMAFNSLETIIEGYRMALEDLWPVVEAARAMSIHDKWTHENCGCPFPALRDALAAVEVE